VRRRLTVIQVRRLVETALALPPPPMSAAPLPPDDEPNGGGLSRSRLEALEAAALQSLRQRLMILLADRNGWQHRPTLPVGRRVAGLVTTPARTLGSAPPPATRTDRCHAELTAAA
jgi:hypothetical protein